MKTINVQEEILKDLQNRYQKSVLNKKELAYETGLLTVFPLIYVADYLSDWNHNIKNTLKINFSIFYHIFYPKIRENKKVCSPQTTITRGSKQAFFIY